MRDAIIEKLNQGITTLGQAVEMLRTENEQSPTETPDHPSPSPWVPVAEGLIGKHEVQDNAELTQFLGINPSQAWCAAFANACYRECGIEGTGSMRAKDFENWGQKCDEIDGALGVFEGETGGHVGFVRGDKLLGGNQGDSVKYSNLAWFKSNMKLLGYRWPSDYPIPT